MQERDSAQHSPRLFLSLLVNTKAYLSNLPTRVEVFVSCGIWCYKVFRVYTDFYGLEIAVSLNPTHIQLPQ